MIKITFECDGCKAKAAQKRVPRRGKYKHDTIEDVAPEGWQVFDPLFGGVYCPECWAGITRSEIE